MLNSPEKRVVVAIYACQDNAEATVLTALLRDRGIECFQSTPLPQSVYPMASGGVTLYVDESSAEDAAIIIEESRGAT